MRHREMLVKSAAQHIPRVQKAMEKMKLKLTEVISNILGATCTAIPDAILASERDPHQLAKFRNDKCRNDEATVAVALQGNWRDERLFSLRQVMDLYRYYHQKIVVVND